jgi:hypothetical protein
MFDVQQSRKMQEHEMVLAIVKEVEVWRLGHFDGCCCCWFRVRDVQIDVSCGKGSERAVRVYSQSDDYWNENSKSPNEVFLRPIAEEVARQVEMSDHRGPLPLHFHDPAAKRTGTINVNATSVSDSMIAGSLKDTT